MKSTLRLLPVAFIALVLSTSFAMASISLDVDLVVQSDFQIDKEVGEFLPVAEVAVKDAVEYIQEDRERMPNIKLVSNRSFTDVVSPSFEIGWRIAA
jgi:hypothetical protein